MRTGCGFRRLLATLGVGVWFVMIANAGAPAPTPDASGETLFASGTARRPACSSCHGRDGRGGWEGTPPAPPIGWTVLSRERGYADAQQLRATLQSGKTPDGRELATLMPRIELTSREAESLARFLEQAEFADSGGVSRTSVRIGVVTSGPTDRFAEALRMALVAAGDTVYRRKIVVAAMPPDALQQDVLAVVGLPETVAGPLSRAFARAGVPNLFQRGMLLGTEQPVDALGFGPTLLQAAAAAEKLTECARDGLDIIDRDPDETRRLRAVLRTGVAGADACRMFVAALPDGSMPVVLLRRGETTLALDPFAALRDRDGVVADAGAALATLAAQFIVRALAVAGRDPTRTAFMRALRTIRLATHDALDLSAPRLSASDNASFTVLERGR